MTGRYLLIVALIFVVLFLIMGCFYSGIKLISTIITIFSVAGSLSARDLGNKVGGTLSSFVFLAILILLIILLIKKIIKLINEAHHSKDYVLKNSIIKDLDSRDSVFKDSDSRNSIFKDSDSKKSIFKDSSSKDYSEKYANLNNVISNNLTSTVYLRALATIFDFIIFLILLIFCFVLAKLILHTSEIVDILVFSIFSIYIILVSVYYLFLEAFTGYTIGKFICKIRVIDNFGNSPGFGKGFKRTFLRLIEVNPFLFGCVIAFISCLKSTKRQRLGDKIADTYVVFSKSIDKKQLPLKVKAVSTAIALIIIVLTLFSIPFSIYSYNKINSVKDYISEDEPKKIPPTIKDNTILTPNFELKNTNFSAGTAFAVVLPGAKSPLILTALHLFGPNGGLPEKISSVELPNVIKKVTFKDAFSGQECIGEATEVLALADAQMSPHINKDLAAFYCGDNMKINTLRISASTPIVGEKVFLAASIAGKENTKLHPAFVCASTDKLLTYTFLDKTVELQGTSGSPILNYHGEVVGINIDSSKVDGKVIGLGNPFASFKTMLLKAIFK